MLQKWIVPGGKRNKKKPIYFGKEVKQKKKKKKIVCWLEGMEGLSQFVWQNQYIDFFFKPPIPPSTSVIQVTPSVTLEI